MKASEHAAELPDSTAPELTLGVFQQHVKPGMSQGDVAAMVGSPNLVSSEGAGRETWIYDKISSEYAYSSSSSAVGGGAGGGVGGLGLKVGGSSLTGIGGGVQGGGGAVSSKASGAGRTTKKTLTVVIRFENGAVTDWKYHQSKF
ncbi:MAG TPA: hypothetical protein PKA41_18125 [Verrucomicrobiota bacterium]|nr:hypothetical protein [Verrucomicrobiota bacterium]